MARKVKVSDLKPGDKVRTSSLGTFQIVKLIRIIEGKSGRSMYNFETNTAGGRFCARGGAKVEVLS